MRVFLSYRFGPTDNWIPAHVVPILHAFDHEVVSGVDLAGRPLVERLKDRITSCQWLIAFNTKSDSDLQSPWIPAELVTAVNEGMRTLEIREAGATELSGFTRAIAYLTFEQHDRAQLFVNLINTLASWRDDEYSSIPNRRLGFHNTLKAVEAQVREAKRLLIQSGSQPVTTKPFRFDLSDECLNTYAEAVEGTEKRFWVTVYFSSGFWQNPPARAVNANADLSRRVGSNGDLRRLFLLPVTKASEFERRQDERLAFKKANSESGLHRQKIELENLAAVFREQQQSGFKIRITHDKNEHYKSLSIPHFDPTDTELALFDDRRLDVYSGGRIGRIQTVHCYTSLVEDYDGFIRPAERYFEQLWAEAEPIDTFLEELKRKLRDTDKKIDYDPTWLAQYELGLKPDDESLKAIEIARVEEILTKRGLEGKLKSILDIGTCTGRYPIALAKFAEQNAAIHGIDSDNDCVRFANALVRRNELGGRIDIMRLDFMSSDLDGLLDKYELVTCMLGTLSHFGMDRTAVCDDELQRCLVSMKDHLDNDGLLIIGQWSDSAIRQDPPQLLTIYELNEARRLASWSCSEVELSERFTKAGLVVKEKIELHQRLNLYVCERPQQR